jgi:acetyl esterase/lipase
MRFGFLILFLAVLGFSCRRNDARNTQQNGDRQLTNIAYGSDPLQKMDIYLPAGRSTDHTKMIVFIHGGSWQQGDKSDLASYVTAIQRRLPDHAVANINYRLATGTTNHFPTQENDISAAVRFLMEQASDYGVSKEYILLGLSAGAHLALLQAYKQPLPSIAAVIDFYGPADLTSLYNDGNDDLRRSMQILLNGSPTTNANIYLQSSPVNQIHAQAPPTLILHGTADNLVPIAQSTALKERLKDAGVPVEMIVYPNEGHGWSGAKLEDSFDQIVGFIKEYAR